MMDHVLSIIRWTRTKMGQSPEKLHLKYHMGVSQRKIDIYLQHEGLKKLHLGAQNQVLKGWLNVDIHPRSDEVVYLDATKIFPLPDQSFQFVFSEHMIEHVSLQEAGFMLTECFRVLQPGGRIRIATPDIMQLATVLTRHDKKEVQEYTSHYVKRFFEEGTPIDPVFVVNKMFYGFHHKFIHSFSSLKWLLEQAGFANVVTTEVGRSEVDIFDNVEMHGNEIGESINRFETIVVEAQKTNA